MKKDIWFSFGILILAIILFVPGICHAEKRMIQVIADIANIQSSPGFGNKIILQVTEGTILESDLLKENWHKVILPSDEAGRVQFGYMHKSFVENMDNATEPEQAQTFQDIGFPNVAKESFLSRVLEKISFNLGGGIGFLLNGGGDVEKLRAGTEEAMSEYGALPDFSSEFDWKKMNGTSHFEIGLNYHISPHFSIGINSGSSRAKSENNQYSFGFDMSEPAVFSEIGLAHPTILRYANALSEVTYNRQANWDFTTYWLLRQFYFFVNMRYYLPAFLIFGKAFNVYGYFGFGPRFAKMINRFNEFYTHSFSFVNPDSTIHHEEYSERNNDIETTAKSIALGVYGGLGGLLALTPKISLWLALNLGLGSSNNWDGEWTDDWSWVKRWYHESHGWYDEQSDSGTSTGTGNLKYHVLDDPLRDEDTPAIWAGKPTQTFRSNFPEKSKRPVNIGAPDVRLQAGLQVRFGKNPDPPAKTKPRRKKKSPPQKTRPRTKKTPTKKGPKKATQDPPPPPNIYTSVNKPNCNCPCPIGLEVEILVEVKVGSWISIYKDIVKDEFSHGDTSGDHSVSHQKEKIIQVNFSKKELDNWQKNSVKITVYTTTYFAKELPENCCVAGEGSFIGSATIITDEKVTDTTRVPRPTGTSPNPRLSFALGSCSGELCCRVAFEPYHLEENYKIGSLPRIELDGWVFTQASTYLEK